MLENGKKYKAKAIDSGLGESLGGQPQPWVKFKTLDAGDEITYFGNLNGSTPEKKAQAEEITGKALVAAGFVGNDIGDLSKPFAVMFPNVPEVTLAIAVEEYKGKKQTKIKGVYSQSAAPKKFMGQAPKMAAVFEKARKELGVKNSTPSKTDDIPF